MRKLQICCEGGDHMQSRQLLASLWHTRLHSSTRLCVHTTVKLNALKCAISHSVSPSEWWINFTGGERRAAAFRALWLRVTEPESFFCKAGLKYIITTQETREDILSIRSDGELKSAALMTVLNAAAPVLSPAVSSVWVMCCLTQEWMAKDGDVNSGC